MEIIARMADEPLEEIKPLASSRTVPYTPLGRAKSSPISYPIHNNLTSKF